MAQICMHPAVSTMQKFNVQSRRRRAHRAELMQSMWARQVDGASRAGVMSGLRPPGESYSEKVAEGGRRGQGEPPKLDSSLEALHVSSSSLATGERRTRGGPCTRAIAEGHTLYLFSGAEPIYPHAERFRIRINGSHAAKGKVTCRNGGDALPVHPSAAPGGRPMG